MLSLASSIDDELDDELDDPLVAVGIRDIEHLQNINAPDNAETLAWMADDLINLDLSTRMAEAIIQTQWNRIPSDEPPPWTDEEVWAAVSTAYLKAWPPPHVSAAPKPPAGYSELLDANEALPPLEYLVDGLFAKNDVILFAAYGGSLKTWIVLSLMLAIQSGQRWLGAYPVQQGNVLFLDYESGRYEALRRLKLLAKGSKVPPIRYRWDGGHLHTEATWAAIETEVVKYDIKLVVIDSLAAGSNGQDENDARFATPLSFAAKLAEEYGVAVWFIHHERKGDGSGAEKIRGTSALYNAADATWRCPALKEDGGIKRTRLMPVKPGAGPTPRPVPLKLSDAGGLQIDTTEAHVDEDTTRQDILAFLKLRGASGQGATMKEIEGGVRGVRNETKRSELASLLKEGAVAKINGRHYVDSPEQQLERVNRAIRDGRTRRADIIRLAPIKAEQLDELVRQRRVILAGKDYALADVERDTQRTGPRS
jgi:hypothetical protein